MYLIETLKMSFCKNDLVWNVLLFKVALIEICTLSKNFWKEHPMQNSEQVKIKMK